MERISLDHGARIRDRRLALGLRQIDLAERVGVSRGYISQVEKGLASPPSTNVLTRWSLALEWPSDAMKKLLGAPTRETTESLPVNGVALSKEVMAYIDHAIDERVRVALGRIVTKDVNAAMTKQDQRAYRVRTQGPTGAPSPKR
jgi:transcriptional regulator with XRE-family HTH domain